MFETGNYIEAVLWGLIGFAFLLAAIKPSKNRLQYLFLALVFFAFGGSDIVEVRTGAWWRPWWLLIWKGVCVLVMLQQFIRYTRRAKQEES